MSESSLHWQRDHRQLLITYRGSAEVLCRVIADSVEAMAVLEELAAHMGISAPADAAAGDEPLAECKGDEILLVVSGAPQKAAISIKIDGHAHELPIEAAPEELAVALLDFIQSMENGFIGIDFVDIRTLLSDAAGPATYWPCTSDELDADLASHLSGSNFTHILAVFRGTESGLGMSCAIRNLEKLGRSVSGKGYAITAAPDEAVTGVLGKTPRVSLYGWRR